MPKKRRAARGGVSGWDRDGVGRAEEEKRGGKQSVNHQLHNHTKLLAAQPHTNKATTQPHKTTHSTTAHKQSKHIHNREEVLNCTNSTILRLSTQSAAQKSLLGLRTP